MLGKIILEERFNTYENMEKFFDKCAEILGGSDAKVCFMSSVAINSEALREVYPGLSLGCFIRKPVTMDYLVKRIMAELD